LIPDEAKGLLPVPTDNRNCLIMRPVLLELFWKPTYFRPKRTFASRRLLNPAQLDRGPTVSDYIRGPWVLGTRVRAKKMNFVLL
jgi:hypothetical protein